MHLTELVAGVCELSRRVGYDGFCLVLRLLVGLGVAIVVGSTVLADESSSALWREVEPDLEMLRIAAFSPSIIAPEFIAVRTSLARFEVEVVSASDLGKQRTSASAIVANTGAVLAVNANFFDEVGKPLGLVMSRGLQQSKLHLGGQTLSGVFTFGAAGPAVVEREQFVPDSVWEAVQAGPRLMVRGKKTNLKSQGDRSSRVGLCIDRRGALVFFATTNWPLGITLTELQSLMQSLDCYNALNLDGGGSRQFEFAPLKADFKVSIPSDDLVPVFLTLKRDSNGA